MMPSRRTRRVLHENDANRRCHGRLVRIVSVRCRLKSIVLLLLVVATTVTAFSTTPHRHPHVSPFIGSSRTQTSLSLSKDGTNHQIENKASPPATEEQVDDAPSLQQQHSNQDTASSLQQQQHANGAKMSSNSSTPGDAAVVSSKATLSTAPHTQMTRNDKVVTGLSLAAFCLFFQQLLQLTGPHGWRYFLAGGVCAGVSHAITTPIDVVKTRQQVDTDFQNMGVIKCAMKIARTEGINALLAGLGPTTVGYLFEGSIKFGVYEVLKPAVAKLLKQFAKMGLTSLESTLFAFTVCGTAAGVAASVVLCPMEALRIRMVAEPDFCKKWVEGLTKMLKYEGVTGLWKGIKPMMLKQVPYTVMKNVSFDVFTKWAYMAARVGGYKMTSTLTTAIPLVSAFLASVLSCLSSQPGDTLLSLVNAHEGNRRMRDFAKDIVKSDQGVGGFFVGVRARFFHVGTIVTMQLLLYDFVKRLCGIAPTGSV